MDWLSSFDPAAQRSSARSGTGSSGIQSFGGSSYNYGAQQYGAAQSFAPGPSTIRPNNNTPRPPQIGRTQPYLPTNISVAGPSNSAYRPRPPRPPHRIKAAPPSAALRSEDAQPNENETRTKPWEIAAPPSIGAARSKLSGFRPCRPPKQPQPSQNRNAAPFPLPQRPQPQQPYYRPTDAPLATARAQPKAKKKKGKKNKNKQWQPYQPPPPKKPRLRLTAAPPRETPKEHRTSVEQAIAVKERPPEQVPVRSRVLSPKLGQLSGVMSIVERSPEFEQAAQPSIEEQLEGSSLTIGPAQVELSRIEERFKQPPPTVQPKGAHDPIMDEAREAEELARYLEELDDDDDDDDDDDGDGDESMTLMRVAPVAPIAAVKQEANLIESIYDSPPRVIKAEVSDILSEPQPGVRATQRDPRMNGAADASDNDDDDDRPLAEVRGISSCDSHVARTARLDSADSNPDEDVPLQDLLQRHSSTGPSMKTGSIWPSRPFQPKILGLNQPSAFSGARGLSIKYFVPLASATLEAQTSMRSRATMFDAAIAVTEHGRIATFHEQPSCNPDEPIHGLPSKAMRFQTRDLDVAKIKGEKVFSPIDRVEDVSRLTSKVCGIVSSTRKLLGFGNHDEYPCQVSLVTVSDTGRLHRTYHLDDRPHVQGASSISHFPRTDPKDASSIDFATGGIDGIVNHWHWKAKSTKADTFRLHTLHDAKPVVALEHLSSRSKILASASIGTVVGFDLDALTLGFSWSTSDHIVHLQRTPDPKLMLGALARRDYDQFRMFDITGRNGPISRPVISFGWLNDAEGKLPLGRGTFHPTRRAIFAHGAEDGHVRVWDMRNARDPLIDQRIGDEPIVETVWASPKGGSDNDDVLYVATAKGVRSISLLAP
ncbi:uncharacterized protein UTRI_05614 [Ustilago trichophora]|uniref:WD40 repeat-like protein n=1 Tax=Ustilago trichophora TaxID=86804 RepID=A0A5C3EFK9_9BASI|nr:uncharacterized protein UTRI_05614 [Ustilago trichophora]